MWRKSLLIILFFLFITFIMTFPLMLNLKGSIPGFFSTDEPYGYIWDLWRIKPVLWGSPAYCNIDRIAVPFGIDICNKKAVASLFIFFSYILSKLFDHVLAYNFQIIINYLLSGYFAYLLVLHVTKDELASIFGGIIFAFCPYHFVRSWQHLGATYTQWMPLYLLSLILLADRVNLKYALLAGACLFLSLTFNFYDGYFMVIATMSFMIFLAFCHRQKKLKVYGLIMLFLIVVFILILPMVFPALSDVLAFNAGKLKSAPAAFSNIRPFEDLFYQSARQLSYVLPAVSHPIFGKFTQQWVGSQLYGTSFTEHTLYLGWTSLIFAFIAFRVWRKRRKNKQLTVNSEQLTEKEDFYIGFFVFLAIVAWFFSQPPWWQWGELKIYMPSFFMYHVLPMFRAYCRFGIVVMLAVSVLAGFGLKFILERLKTQKAKIAVTMLFCGLILFEFWSYPSFKVIDISRIPQVYYWIKDQAEDFVIAEYPLDANGPNEKYKFYQVTHHKKIVNGTIPGTYANRVAKTITRLSSKNTTGVLKWMGVKYVLVHREDYLSSELAEDREELEKISRNPRLKLVKSFPGEDCPQKDIMCLQKTGPVDVYELSAKPLEPKVKE